MIIYDKMMLLYSFRGDKVHLYIIKSFIDIAELIIFLLGVYYLCIAVFSLFAGTRHSNRKEIFRFIAIIPAHNEADTVDGVISSIRNTDYPQELIKILVVADGCTDATISIAKKNGAEVLIRDKSTTKGDVLTEVFKHINGKYEYDVAAVFDADNIVDKNFFSEVCERMALGKEIVQGYIDSKNPDTSWVSYAYSIWYWIYNRVSQSGRARLNLGCRICGTGFAVKREVLDAVEWNTTTTAEDCEYTYMLAENGIKVDFCESAVVYDEKPVGFKESVLQRTRWMQGICDVQGEYTLRLLKGFKINAVLGLWGEFLNVFCFVFLLASYIFKIGDIWQTIAGGVVLWVYITAYILSILLAMLKDKKFNKKIILNLFGYMVYIASWIPIGVMGIFGKRKGWYHTKHSDAV